MPKEYVFMSDSYQVMICSDGKPTESSYCKRMIGYAVAQRWIFTPKLGYG